MRSGRMPSLMHQTDRRERRPKAVDAKGVPLSERIRWGNPNSGGSLAPLMTGSGPCRRRCERLYIPPGGKYYGCRRCHDLSYTSRREDRAYRMLRKANKIRFGKLGWGDEPTDFAAPRPKGMHRRTYERLCREEQALRDHSLTVFAADYGLPRGFLF